MRVGIALGVIAVLLVVFSRQIIGNFGTTTLVDGTLLAVMVTIIHQFLITAFVAFSAALVAASLVMRHTESIMKEKAGARGAGKWN